MGPLVIVGPEPLSCEVLYVSNRFKQVMAQPIIAHRAVIPFDVGILLRISGLDMGDGKTAFLRPGQEGIADVFRAVVAANGLWRSAPFDYLL